MNILFLSRSNSGIPNPFIKEQAEALMENYNLPIQHFLIPTGGVRGYSKAIIQLHDYIKQNKIDLIHVHYGLWALIAVLNNLYPRKYKIVITFHGSDINKKYERKISLLGAYFSSHNILVSEKMVKYFHRNYSIIPCGIDTNINLVFRTSTREKMGWDENDFIVLFSSSFERKEKDPEFAQRVIESFSKTTKRSVKFIELKGYTRNQLTHLMQAGDALIMCSEREGSPQVIKESILNGLPVVSNDVGDVRLICSGVDNCFIVQKNIDEYVKHLQYLSKLNVRIKNRSPVIEKYNNKSISEKLFNIYTGLLKSS